MLRNHAWQRRTFSGRYRLYAATELWHAALSSPRVGNTATAIAGEALSVSIEPMLKDPVS
jgi:hypothetical protein